MSERTCPCGCTNETEHRANGHKDGDFAFSQHDNDAGDECRECVMTSAMALPWVYAIGEDGKRHRHPARRYRS